jgi:Ca2+-binding EF-hand superfamily protein
LQKADTNGDGFLSADEYYTILKAHGVECSREEIVQMMQIADKDHDGSVLHRKDAEFCIFTAIVRVEHSPILHF